MSLVCVKIVAALSVTTLDIALQKCYDQVSHTKIYLIKLVLSYKQKRHLQNQHHPTTSSLTRSWSPWHTGIRISRQLATGSILLCGSHEAGFGLSRDSKVGRRRRWAHGFRGRRGGRLTALWGTIIFN